VTHRLAYDGYFADPFVLKHPGGYVAVGTGGSTSSRGFDGLVSEDLRMWRSVGPVLEPLPEEAGDAYWAPEVAFVDGRFLLYYSLGQGIAHHHIRVAESSHPTGPYRDLGVDLTPGEAFAIDPHPFRDDDGRWYLYFAHDVLDGDRPGTHLAVAPLESMTRLGPVTSVLSPNDDWQIYERARSMYEAVYDWHTLEGPTVVRRHDRYWMTYSGGAWTGEGYGVSWAVADSPLGPWSHAPAGTRPLLRTQPGGLIGPGHNSIVAGPDGRDVIVFHAWTADGMTRRMYAGEIEYTPEGPRIGASTRMR
jgi:GH43 family beta-xylosidase